VATVLDHSSDDQFLSQPNEVACTPLGSGHG
jgi:hypothetical protein